MRLCAAECEVGTVIAAYVLEEAMMTREETDKC
jgi:hypothetical protein